MNVIPLNTNNLLKYSKEILHELSCPYYEEHELQYYLYIKTRQLKREVINVDKLNGIIEKFFQLKLDGKEIVRIKKKRNSFGR